MKWLQWIIDNAWTLVIIGGVLAQLMKAVRGRQEEGEIPRDGGAPKEYEFEDPELAERTRRIREEIQRKIAQRQHGPAATAPEPAAPEPVPPPVIREVAVPAAEPPPVLAPSSARWESRRQAEILEQQATWQEKLEEAQRYKAAVQKRTAFEEATSDHRAERRAATRTTVLGDLRDPAALRRAFILREVLGPPVALRR